MDWMSITGWVLVVLLFAVGMAGTIYPVLPGALAICAAYFVYGLFISWEPFGLWFWLIQTAIVAVLFVADYAVSALGVQKFGGSKASVWGSTIGLILGPFVIPAFGLIIGPFAGAAIGELLIGKDWKQAVRSGLGALVGFFTGTFVKILLQGLMIVLFIIWIWD